MLTGLAAVLGCGSTTKPCNPGTVLVTVTFDQKTKAADSIEVDVRIDGGAPKTTTLAHKAGDTQGSVEIFFPNGSGYPVGKRLDVDVVARSGQLALGTVRGTVAMVPMGCASVSVKFGAPGDGGAGADGGDGAAGAGGTSGDGGAAGAGGDDASVDVGDDGGAAGAGGGDASGGADGGAAGAGGTSGDGGAAGAGGDDASVDVGDDGGAAGAGGGDASGGADGGAAGAGGQPGCADAATRPCSAGGVLGKCAGGTETCAGGKWGACSITPAAADVCDTKGDDSNCNGTTNDGCPCVTGDVRVCGDAGAKGNCAKGAQTCTNGKWDACTVQPATSDTCATKGDDANCNGIPNEGCACLAGDPARSCAAAGAKGNCAAGTQACVAGQWGACSVAAAASDSCAVKGDDANCNGTVNDGCACITGDPARLCSAGGAKGNCAKGSQSCAAGVWGACTVQPAVSDSCAVKGDDANCNGTPNDGCPCVSGDTQPCGPAAVGICKPGTQTCSAGVWGACVGAVNKAARDCTSAADNDCDGKPDNTIDLVCKCASGGTQACGAHPGNDGKGPCHAGTQACVVAANKATSDWGACGGAVGPAGADTCVAGNDDNCSGTLNDGCACVNGVTTRACGFCGDGSQTCTDGKNNTYTACAGGTPGQSFTALALAAGVSNAPFSTAKAAAALDCSGFVQLKGAVQASTSSTVLMTLPAVLRPSAEIFIPADLCDGNKGRVDIASDGTVSVEVLGGDLTQPQCFVSLESVRYPVAAKGFSALPLINGWSGYPFTRGPAITSVGGVVSFEGALSAPSGTTLAPFTVPLGFRPPTDVYVPVDLCNAGIGRLHFTPSGAVTIDTSGAATDATCFTSLESASFALSASGFTAMTLVNGWVSSPFLTRPVAAINIGGIVHFEGAMSTGTTGAAFTLPVGLRPVTDVYIPVGLCDAGKGRMFISSSGVVTISDAALGFTDAPCFTSFEGATFGL